MRHSLRHSKKVFAALLAVAAVLVPAPGGAADDAADVEVDIGYHALKPSIVSNLTGGPKYIRCDIQLMTEQRSEIPTLQLHNAPLRHEILMLLAGADGQALTTPAGKEALRQAALAAIREQLEELAGKPIVKDLYFTAYYVR